MIISNAIKTISLAMPLTIVAIFGSQPGALEGHLFPVITSYKIISETVARDGNIDISVDLNKARECQRVSLEFYIQDADKYWYFTPRSGASTIPNEVGLYHTMWKLFAPARLIGRPIKIVAHHQCWGEPMWLTDTTTIVTP